jgi:hypothetical protein
MCHRSHPRAAGQPCAVRWWPPPLSCWVAFRPDVWPVEELKGSRPRPEPPGMAMTLTQPGCTLDIVGQGEREPAVGHSLSINQIYNVHLLSIRQAVSWAPSPNFGPLPLHPALLPFFAFPTGSLTYSSVSLLPLLSPWIGALAQWVSSCPVLFTVFHEDA